MTGKKNIFVIIGSANLNSANLKLVETIARLTENEFNLADKLGKQFRFCFVSLHSESKCHVLLTSEELALRIRTKRLQYQINL